ncbi:hypothetical protein EL76_5041 [Escherichia coli G3/10]|nr:hypothetical protein EL76_5041 [Escherichia coli G3/10]
MTQQDPFSNTGYIPDTFIKTLMNARRLNNIIYSRAIAFRLHFISVTG